MNSADQQQALNAGFCPQRLQRLAETFAGLVDNGTFAGVVTHLSRRGVTVQQRTHGVQDLETRIPMALDTIFPIASMTKPVTGVAMMLLYEEGKWRPEDPLHRHIPEFKELEVFAGLDAEGRIRRERPHHAPTVGEVMSHTAGFGYGFRPDQNPIDKLYSEKAVLGRDVGGPGGTLQDMIDKLAQIPLLYQPGARWLYSVSVDIQGYLVERFSGKSLPDFCRERIFEPLGMVDTGFSVPREKLGRIATCYRLEGGKLIPVPSRREPTVTPTAASGGGGLLSTPQDYARFAQMLCNKGVLDGVRLLAPSSVRLMSANHLDEALLANGAHGQTTQGDGFLMPDTLNENAFGIAFYKARPGVGFGYDVSVIYDPDRAGRSVGAGTYHWDGAFGTFFWVDPENEIVFVGMLQRADLHVIPNVQELARVMVSQALVDPS